jgi:hypothetical protein
MSFTGIFYTLVIWFPNALIEFLFVLFKKILGDPGAAIVAASVYANPSCFYRIRRIWRKNHFIFCGIWAKRIICSS